MLAEVYVVEYPIVLLVAGLDTREERLEVSEVLRRDGEV